MEGVLKTELRNITSFGKDSTFLVLLPEISVGSKITSFQSIKLRYGYTNTNAELFNLYGNHILTDYRNLNSGFSSFFKYGTHVADFNYNNSEFHENYFSFNLNLNFKQSNAGFITNNFLQNTLFYTELVPYKGLKSLNYSVGLRKFAPIVATKFDLNINSGMSNYYSNLGSQINQYKSKHTSIIVNASTGFNLPINFIVGAQYQTGATYLLDEKLNENHSYKFNLDTRLKISNSMYSYSDFNFYKLNGRDYFLINTEMSINPSKGPFKYSISGKNLTNIRSFNSFYINEVATIKSSSTILGRYVLLNISYSIK